MDIFRCIENDHQKVTELFQKLHNTKGPSHNRQDLFTQLKEELELHTHAEERVFYPAIQDTDVTHDMVLDAQEDHRLVDEILEELSDSSPDDAAWHEKLLELQENVEGHVEIEESEIFDAARQLLSQEQAQKLAEQWQRVKQEQLTARVSQ